MESLGKQLKLPSPLQFLKDGIFKGMNFAIKRDDCIHPLVSGNKWRKLQGTLEEYDSSYYTSISTFGGSFSNHLIATAAICSYKQIPCRAFVRTDLIDNNNPTLSICNNLGMELIAMDRLSYSKKHEYETLSRLKIQYSNSFFIPEGGSTKNAYKGIHQCLDEIIHDSGSFDTYITSLGTGATSAGMLNKLSPKENILIFPAIKGVTENAFSDMYMNLHNEKAPEQFEILYHLDNKSYAKKDMQLFQFIEEFLIEYDILLDPIYTGKAMRTFLDSHKMEQKQSYCFIHTGGIQAWNGYFYRYPNLSKELPEIYGEMQRHNLSYLI